MTTGSTSDSFSMRPADPGPDTDAAAVRRAFERAVRVHDFVHYREAGGWARGLDDAIDSIEQLLKDGQSAVVIELCESALHSLLGAIEAVDDSDGHFSTLHDRLQDIRACQEARPDPVDLAKRLFQWELHSDFDVFYGAAAQYAKILGAKGMKVYRELAEAEWAKVPARTAKHERSEYGQHFRITHIMESLAQASGNIEELVAVMRREGNKHSQDDEFTRARHTTLGPWPCSCAATPTKAIFSFIRPSMKTSKALESQTR